MPGTDPIAVEAAPTLIGAMLRVGATVLLLAGAGWGWVWWLKRRGGATRRVEVQERVFLARGTAVALLRVDERRLLVGVSPEGVRLISELDPEAPQAEATPTTFAGVLAEAGERRGAS